MAQGNTGTKQMTDAAVLQRLQSILVNAAEGRGAT
jgi:hypothetical protein